MSVKRKHLSYSSDNIIQMIDRNYPFMFPTQSTNYSSNPFHSNFDMGTHYLCPAEKHRYNGSQWKCLKFTYVISKWLVYPREHKERTFAETLSKKREVFRMLKLSGLVNLFKVRGSRLAAILFSYRFPEFIIPTIDIVAATLIIIYIYFYYFVLLYPVFFQAFKDYYWGSFLQLVQGTSLTSQCLTSNEKGKKREAKTDRLLVPRNVFRAKRFPLVHVVLACFFLATLERKATTNFSLRFATLRGQIHLQAYEMKILNRASLNFLGPCKVIRNPESR